MELTWERVVAIVVACAAAINWGVPYLKSFVGYIDTRRKAKRETEIADKTNNADLRRIENESEKAHLDRLNTEIRELKAEIKELKESPSLSFASRTKWYQKYRHLGVELDKFETKIVREMPHNLLLTSMAETKKSYDELGETMP